MITAIGEIHRKSATQVVLCWHVQPPGCIPRSADPGRIEENIDIFDFQLSEQEMEQDQRARSGSRDSRFRHLRSTSAMEGSIHDELDAGRRASRSAIRLTRSFASSRPTGS